MNKSSRSKICQKEKKRIFAENGSWRQKRVHGFCCCMSEKAKEDICEIFKDFLYAHRLNSAGLSSIKKATFKCVSCKHLTLFSTLVMVKWPVFVYLHNYAQPAQDNHQKSFQPCKDRNLFASWRKAALREWSTCVSILTKGKKEKHWCVCKLMGAVDDKSWGFLPGEKRQNDEEC